MNAATLLFLPAAELSIAPAIAHLPLRSPECEPERELRASLGTVGICEPLLIDAEKRVWHGRHRWRWAGEQRKSVLVPCRQVVSARCGADFAECNAFSPAWNQGQRALVIVSQHWHIFSDSRKRGFSNLCPGGVKPSVPTESEPTISSTYGRRETIQELCQRFGIGEDWLRWASCLYECRDGAGATHIQSVMDGTSGLGGAYASLKGDESAQPQQGKRRAPEVYVRRWLDDAANQIPKIQMITSEDELAKLIPRLAEVRDALDQLLVPFLEGAR